MAAATATSKPRKGDLDFIRIMAILAVIAIHCIAPVFVERPIGSGAWVVANIIDSFARWCVPVFIMISGALVIKKQTFANGEILPYLKKRMSRIAIPLLAWPFLYMLWGVATKDMEFNLMNLLQGYLAGHTPPGYHLYFLFIIAGLYLLTPLINAYVSVATRKQLWYVTIAILAATAVWSLAGYVLPNHAGSLNIVSRCLPFVGYFLLGYLLRDITIKRQYIPVILFVATSSLIAALTYFSFQHESLYFYNNASVTVLLVSPMAFLAGKVAYGKLVSLIAKKNRKKADNTLLALSNASFGVYLVHVIVLQALVLAFHFTTASLKAALVIMALTAIISWAITLIMLRIPHVNRLVR